MTPEERQQIRATWAFEELLSAYENQRAEIERLEKESVEQELAIERVKMFRGEAMERLADAEAQVARLMDGIAWVLS